MEATAVAATSLCYSGQPRCSDSRVLLSNLPPVPLLVSPVLSLSFFFCEVELIPAVGYDDRDESIRMLEGRWVFARFAFHLTFALLS